MGFNSDAWARANPERHRENKREQRRQHRLRGGHILDKMRKLKVSRPKPSNCEVCGNGGIICLDHCHVKNEFRGWLCNGCNAALGFTKDNPETLRKLAEYLEQRKPP